MRFSGVKRPSKHNIGFEALERRVVLKMMPQAQWKVVLATPA